MKKVWMAAILLTTMFAGCKKDDEEETNRPRSELIIGTWRFTDFTSSQPLDYDGDGDEETQLYSLLEACERDNLFVFQTGGVYTLNEGASKCDASDPQTEDGTWSLSNNDNTIILDGISLELPQLDQATMKIAMSQQDVGGSTVTVTLTYTRQ